MTVNTIDAIVRWSKTLPQWQSDALRRLFVSGSLTQGEKKEIINMAKSANGVKLSITPPTPIPFSTSHAPGQSQSKNVIYLKKIRDVKNVNALASGQTISLGGVGITVIYGDNGTGKSGYSRLLKRACRARHTEAILPNINNPSYKIGVPEAIFDIQEEGSDNEVPMEWKEGGAAPEKLSQIAVFDTHCARVFVDDANAVNYIPYGLDVFPKFVRLIDELKAEISNERSLLMVRNVILNELSGEHEVGKVIATLSSNSNLTDIETLATITEDEQREYETLEVAVRALQVNDPAKQALAIRRTKQRVIQLRDKIQNVCTVLSDDNVEKLKLSWQTAKMKSEATKLASADQFSGEPLPGIGDDAWREMYSHARAFSIQNAYPDKKFPVVDDGSFCLLCMQELDSDAKNRMLRFEKYITDKTEMEANKAKAVLSALYQPIKELPLDDVESALIAEIREKDTALAEIIEGVNISASAIRNSIISAVKTGDWLSLKNLEMDVLDKLKVMIDGLEVEAKAKDELVKPEEQRHLLQKYENLASRIKLKRHKTCVVDHINKLKEASSLSRILNTLNSRPISIKASQLTQEALTTELQLAVSNELQNLKINYINLGLKPSSPKGDTKHQLIITNAKNSDKLTRILSEGEQRVIAIASFLAELSLSPVKSSVVFDDPVSSLDHKWASRIAERLLVEGKERQVIIFTHNISFLLELFKYAGIHQVEISSQNLRRKNNVSGHCHHELPWKARNTTKRNEKLVEIAQQAGKYFKEDPDSDEYQMLHDQFYSRLRSTWERAVEEILLNGVVMRFDSGISTQLLNGVSVDDEDYLTVFNAMSESSEGINAHDHAAGQHDQINTPDDMGNELKKLKEFQKTIAIKKKETTDRRKAKTKPPIPELTL